MKKTTIILILFAVTTACSQKKETFDKIDMDITSHYDNYNYLNDTRPGYYLNINSQNCYYEITVNGLSSDEYYGNFPSYSTRIPINLEILKSGQQKISIKVFPFKGDKLTDKSDIAISLLMYPDMTDMENDFGGSTILWEWSMPRVGNQKLPVFQMDTVFEAKVPYKIEVLDLYAQDLSEMDEEVLLQEVVSEFKIKREHKINGTESLEYLLRHINRAMVQIYPDDKLAKETAKGMITFPTDKEPQPLENFELRLYHNNKIATLLNIKDKEPAIWAKNPETGARSWQPYYIFKHKETGTWHMW